jgi:hypothetical protein
MQIGPKARQICLMPADFYWASSHTRSYSTPEEHSTQHRLGMAWEVTNTARTESTIKLERKLGNDFRVGGSQSPKTSLDWTILYQ